MKGEALAPVARVLRGNQTDAEKRLWSHLCRQQCGGFRFRRQLPLGNFVVDFARLFESLIVKVDGGQHTNRMAQDEARTGWLEGEGYRVIRFWTTMCSRTRMALSKPSNERCRAIKLSSTAPHPSLLKGEGVKSRRFHLLYFPPLERRELGWGWKANRLQ